MSGNTAPLSALYANECMYTTALKDDRDAADRDEAALHEEEKVNETLNGDATM